MQLASCFAAHGSTVASFCFVDIGQLARSNRWLLHNDVQCDGDDRRKVVACLPAQRHTALEVFDLADGVPANSGPVSSTSRSADYMHRTDRDG
jgi:hypothetical protein